MTQLTILQANFLKSNKHPDADHRCALECDADVVGLNEGRRFWKMFACSPGYHAIIARKPGARKNNPILLREDHQVRSWAAYDMCRGVGKSPARAATLVRFDFHGQKRCHIQTHTNAHIENNHKPRKLPRVAQDIVHMIKLARLIRKNRRAGWKVTVAGDFNWDWRAGRDWFWSPKRMFHRNGLAVNWKYADAPNKGSLGKRQIDYIAFDPCDLHPVDQKYVAGEHSDHRWLCVTFNVRGL